MLEKANMKCMQDIEIFKNLPFINSKILVIFLYFTIQKLKYHSERNHREVFKNVFKKGRIENSN